MSLRWSASRARAVVAGLAAAVATAAAPFVSAHPHVFIEYTVTLLGNAQGVEALRFTWTFDEFTSAMIMQEFDRDRDGTLSPAETRNIERRHFGEMRESQYFIALRLDDRPVPVEAVRDFTARATNGIVTYTFTVPLGAARAAEGHLEVLADDPTVFIAFDLSPSAPVQVKASPELAMSCQPVRDPKGAAADLVRCAWKRRGR